MDRFKKEMIDLEEPEFFELDEELYEEKPKKKRERELYIAA